MDISGTAKKIQRATKIAEQTYKKMQMMREQMQELMEQMQQLQSDMETTSRQVDDMEYELAEQRAILEAMADEQGLAVEDVLAEADLPEPPQHDTEPESQSGEGDDEDLSEKATSRPSATEDS